MCTWQDCFTFAGICKETVSGSYFVKQSADFCGFHPEYTSLCVSPPRHLFIWRWSPIRQTWWRLCWEKVPTLPPWTAMAKQRCTSAVNTTRRNACQWCYPPPQLPNVSKPGTMRVTYCIMTNLYVISTHKVINPTKNKELLGTFYKHSCGKVYFCQHRLPFLSWP